MTGVRVLDAVALGRMVRERRRELGHTQEEIADLCGVHRVSIAKLERGGSLKFEIVLRVVHMLGMNIEVSTRGTR
ncbi:MAG TPA: helix-turn-helix transcriptional regulator [Solirubrobacteraceae bacterium]|jgi:transcriptional regulator with XRE-family HTH domain|nr:helix-turn-helix transcriptional regulator [Solirubrobacteraceae bacterium]